MARGRLDLNMHVAFEQLVAESFTRPQSRAWPHDSEEAKEKRWIALYPCTRMHRQLVSFTPGATCPVVGALEAEARELHDEVGREAVYVGGLLVLCVPPERGRALLDVLLPSSTLVSAQL